MSLQNVLESECGSVNPVVGFARHFTDDKAFQERRTLFPTNASNDVGFAPLDAQHLVNEFMRETAQDVEEGQPFRMDELLREVKHMQSTSSDDIAYDWRQQINQNLQTNSKTFDSEWTQNQAKWADEYFSQFDVINAANDTSNVDNKFDDNLNDVDINESQFIEFVKSVGSTESNVTSDELQKDDRSAQIPYMYSFYEPMATNLPNIWDAKYTSKRETKEPKVAEDDSEFWSKLAKDWKEMGLIDEENAGEQNWLPDSNETSEEYKFSEENPHIETINPFEEGLKKLKEGDIPSAVLLFEAAVQKDREDMNAWLYLGTSQAENEHDMAAIGALKQCVQLDANNLTALMALAVSYTNESMQHQACATLKEWIRRNPKYDNIVAHLEPSAQDSSKFTRPFIVSSIITSGHHQEVKDLFIAAARQSPTEVDADVQCGLGVLFNLSGEYDKAADCFQAALQVKPNDSSLWNRLGATLANGSRSEDAINAYREALAISPGFIRSRFNLGISCINLGAYREAAEHLLTVLNSQAAGRGLNASRGLMSGNVWSTLRMVMTLMNRTDMYDAVDRKDLLILNKEFEINDT